MVPLRQNVGENPSSASSRSARSALTLVRAYSVCGASGEFSSATAASDIPYMMHEEDRMKRETPACFAAWAKRTVPSWLMSQVHDLLRLPSGSLLSAAR